MGSLDRAKAVQAELANRILARRRLIHFTQRMNPRYMAGWVHQDICRRLERFSAAVAAGSSPRLMLLMPPRHGKACAVGTLVPTPRGLVPIEKLKPGDFVFGRDGKPTEVVAVSPVWKNRELYQVESDDGATVTVDAEHEWTVRLCRKRPIFKTKTTKQLASRLSDRRPALMTFEAVRFPTAELPLSAYVLGVWLGDGCSHHATMTQGDQDYDWVRTEVENEGVLTTDRATYGTFGLLGTLSVLKALHLLDNKHIPEIYMRASVAQRLALLQGLVDTDGHVAPDGHVELCGVNEQLMRDALQLVRSLGVKASLIIGRATLNGKDCGPKFRVMFYMANAARLPRKAARCRDGVRQPWRFLSITPAGRGDTVCIQVAAEDHQYLVGDGYLLTHNSELASKMFPAWHLGQYPEHEFIACSYNISLAMGFSKKIKMLFDDPSYQTVFDARLDSENRSTEEWGLTAGGGYVAAGVGGGITGKGAHVLAIDDPIKNAEEADSADTREKLWDWYGSTAYTRLAPGGGVLVIQTWWHDDDLAGRLQRAMADDPESDQFEVIKYPAIAEDDEYLDTVTDLIVASPEYQDELRQAVVDASFATRFRLLRNKGEALHPDRYDLPKLLRIKRTIAARHWSALYQQNPVPADGAFFTRDQFRQRPPPPRRECNVAIAWDFAISIDRKNDWTVGTVGLQDTDDILHVADMVRFKSNNSFFIVESMLNLVVRWYDPSLIVCVEDGQIWRTLESVLRKRMRERKLTFSIKVMKPLTDKEVRATPLQARMQQGMVSFAVQPWFETIRNEMLRFPAGVHDDCVDSAAWLTHGVIGRQPPRKKVPPKQASWRDQLNALDRESRSHMSA